MKLLGTIKGGYYSTVAVGQYGGQIYFFDWDDYREFGEDAMVNPVNEKTSKLSEFPSEWFLCVPTSEIKKVSALLRKSKRRKSKN